MHILPPLTGEGAEYDIRKYAHMAEYAALALFSGLFFVELLMERVPARAAIVTVLFCFLYACSDEYHQTFIPGRAGQFSDVLVDMAGAAFGILLTYPLALLRKETK